MIMASAHGWLQLSLPVILHWYKDEQLLASDSGFWPSCSLKGSPCSLPWGSKDRFPWLHKDERIKIPTFPPRCYPGLSKESLNRSWAWSLSGYVKMGRSVHNSFTKRFWGQTSHLGAATSVQVSTVTKTGKFFWISERKKLTHPALTD